MPRLLTIKQCGDCPEFSRAYDGYPDECGASNYRETSPDASPPAWCPLSKVTTPPVTLGTRPLTPAKASSVMSVSISIEAVIPYDSAKFQQMKAIYDACTVAGIELPVEVSEFFHDVAEGAPRVWPKGKRVCLEYAVPAVTGEVMYGDGALVDLSKLPEGTKFIRIGSSC